MGARCVIGDAAHRDNFTLITHHPSPVTFFWIPGAIILGAHNGHVRIVNTVVNTAVAGATAAPHSFKDVWLISAGHAFTHWYTATFYILLPLIGKELGLSYTEIGLIMTAQHVVGAISNLPGGMVVDMVGKKGYLMAISLFWVGFPYALMSLTHSYWMLLLCVTLVGIGNNLWHPAAIPTLAWRYPEDR